MKYLIISGSVTVTGPPSWICFLNKGKAEPEDPNTLPNLTIVNFVLIGLLESKAIDCNIISANRFDAPIILVGLTALSVEIKTKVSTRVSMAALTHDKVPKMLFLTPSKGFSSTRGTCLYAAAC
jgi:hypothetical protein